MCVFANVVRWSETGQTTLHKVDKSRNLTPCRVKNRKKISVNSEGPDRIHGGNKAVFWNNNKSALIKHFRDSSPTLLKRNKKEKETELKNSKTFFLLCSQGVFHKIFCPRNIKAKKKRM